MNESITSVAGTSPEITAPVRIEGQSNSEVLFNWLLVNRYLWMLDSTYEKDLERILDPRARLRLAYMLIQWTRQENHKAHPALTAPEGNDARRAAFDRLHRVIVHHLLGSSDTDETFEGDENDSAQ